MRIFDFDAEQYREQYAEQGWIHVPEGVGAEFLRTLTAFVQDHFAGHEVEGRGVHGTKTQAVYEFPAKTGFPDALFDVISAATGLERKGLTLSERHVKAYDDDAPADQPAHKDRLTMVGRV